MLISHLTTHRVNEKNFLFMMLNLYSFRAFEKGYRLSSFLYTLFPSLIACVYKKYSSSSKDSIFATFILYIVLFDYLDTQKEMTKLDCFSSIGIKVHPFFANPYYLAFLLDFLLIFTNKEHKKAKKLNKIARQTCSYNSVEILSKIIVSLLLINTQGSAKMLENPKQNKSKLLNNPKFPEIVIQLWLKDIDYWIVGFGCENESIDQGISYYQKYINISDCFFSRYSWFSGDGGVIYVEGGSFSININSSMFYNCFANIGGAIYFNSLNSCLRMICANSCSCRADLISHFAFLSASQVNQFDYPSVSNCSHTTSGDYPIYFVSGNQRFDNANISMNNAEWGSGISIDSPTSFSSSHVTFSNNNESNGICIYFYSDSGTISMSYANIVHNNSPQYGVVLVDKEGSKKMIYCIFQNNQNILLYVGSGSLEVSHSFIDHSELSFSSNIVVSILTNNSFTNIVTYQIQFFNSHHCNTDIPPPSRTLDQSPMRSLEKTISRTNEETLRMTYERTIDQTIRKTPIKTLNETLLSTLKESPLNTHIQTIRETPNDTPYRSFAECVFTCKMEELREINVIFSFLLLCVSNII